VKNVAVATDYFKVKSQHLFGALTRTTENLNQNMSSALQVKTWYLLTIKQIRSQLWQEIYVMVRSGNMEQQ